MTALVWLIGLITNILNPIGMVLAIFALSLGDWDIYLVPLIFGVDGLIYGFWAWNYEVAPRMFWIKSRTELFDSRVGCAIGYFISFFNSAMVVMVLIMA